jgi:hypothetical protein
VGAGAVLDGIVGELHERLFQGGLDRRELGQGQIRVRGAGPDLVAGQPGDVQLAGGRAGHLHGICQEQVLELRGLWRADMNRPCGGTRDEVLDGLVPDQPAAADHDQVFGGQRHLAHQVRGHEHGAALVRQAAQQGADPQHPLGVQAVDRLVQHHRGRVAEQRSRDPEALAHPEGEPAHALVRDFAQTDEIDHLRDPPAPDARRRRHRGQVVRRRTARVHAPGLQQRPDLVQRCRVPGVTAAADRHLAGGRRVEPDDHPHRRGLAGSIRAEEPRHDPRQHLEAQCVDGDLLAVTLGQISDLDHYVSVAGGLTRSPRR